MKRRPLLLPAFIASLLAAANLAAGEVARRTIPLDGIWDLVEGQTSQVPARFDRKVPVPGLVDLAEPRFQAGIFNNKRRVGPEDANLAQRSYWYRREFKIDGKVPAVASLLVRKAGFGSTVYLNGTRVGESLASFTANWYDVRAALRGGGQLNELIIRVGASRASLPPSVPSGWDFEKKSYIPGLFDSVELVLSGTPHIVNVQAAPELDSRQVRVQVLLANRSAARASPELALLVREAQSRKLAGRA